MSYCSVKFCDKNSKTSSCSKDGISFHKFPDNPTIKGKWIEATHRENWFPSKFSVICSRHFTSDCFEAVKNKRRGSRLLSLAIPTQFLPILRSSTSNTVRGDPLVIDNVDSVLQIQYNAPDSEHDDTVKVEAPLERSSICPENTVTQIEELPPQALVSKRYLNNLIYSLHKKKQDVKRLQNKNRKLILKNEKLKVILEKYIKEFGRL